MEGVFSGAVKVFAQYDGRFLKLVFVNYAHPDTPHISGVRLWRFAQELSILGHQIVYVTATLSEQADFSSESVATLLELHNWKSPLHIAVEPKRRRLLNAARENRLPRLFHKAFTGYSIVVKGGVFYDWTDAAKECVKDISEIFRPDLVWGTFGNSSNLYLAQAISKSSNSKVVLDFKDSISAFIPWGLRRWFTKKYKSASGISSNAQALGAEATKFFGMNYKCIYSGIESAFYSRDFTGLQADRGESLYFTLTGSIYSEARAKSLIEIFSRWCSEKNSESNLQIKLKYIGGSASQVQRICDQLACEDRVEVNSYIPVGQLAAVCTSKTTVANMYIFGNSFHHKLLELLATGKPVICVGRELDESYRLAAANHCALYSAETDDDLITYFDKALSAFLDGATAQAKTADYSWPAMAKELESYFLQLITSS